MYEVESVGLNTELVGAVALALRLTSSDAVVVAAGYIDAGRSDWVHHYSVQEPNDLVAMVGELELMKDDIKEAIKTTRRKAAAIQRVDSISGATQ